MILVALWHVTAAANAVMVLLYGLIAIQMLTALTRGRQWRRNPVLTATAAIFVACTIGHGVHLEHALGAYVTLGLDADATTRDAARASFADPRLLVWDVFTAAIAIWYFTLRGRFALIYEGAELCEDMDRRQQQASQLHDNVVQGLTEAKLAFDLGDRERGAAAIERSLVASKRIITDMLGREDTPLEMGAGDLRRTKAER